MLWESGSNNKENQDETGSNSNIDPNSNVIPVLLPAQSGTTPSLERVPVVVPDVEELKEQFQLQQNMITQIKETIKENESELSSKGKKVEAYANKLAQIRARTKKNDNKANVVPRKPGSSPVKTLSRKPSKENLAKENDSSSKNKPPQSNVKIDPKAKYNELKRRLQESKIKFEERTGKEVCETKRIESIVENLKMQLEERDITIQELQKLAEQPALPNLKLDTSLRKGKGKEGKPIAFKSTQTTSFEPSDESIEIIALQNRIYELEESLKEKQSVIDARTQAVTLLSQDLSIKGKNTLECLEETRQEMRSMQNNFIIIENQLKKELVEKDERLTSTEEKLKEYERANSELNTKNTKLLERLSDMEKKHMRLESEKKVRKESFKQVEDDDKVLHLSNKISVLNKELDDINKSMIKMKIEHRNKVKNLNKIIEKFKEESDDKAEILRLLNVVEEYEILKESLENKIAELEEEKVTEKRLKEIINELGVQLNEQARVVQDQLQTIANLEKEKFDMSQSAQDQNILIENLYAKIQNLESEMAEKDFRMNELRDELKIKMESSELEGSTSVEWPAGGKKELEESRITAELNNVQVEEQIEMLIREKQQLLDKLRSLSGVSSTESFTFETVEHTDFQSQKECKPESMESAVFCKVGDIGSSEDAKNQDLRLQRIIDEQQTTINDLQNIIKTEKEKTSEYQRKLEKLEDFRNLERANNQLQPEPKEDSEVPKISKSNTNVKNKIKKIQTQLMESRKTIQLQNEKLEELNMKLEEKEQLIKNYIEKIELFEKDDWGRENDWKTTQDDFEHVRELQKKCLSLENSLIELTEDCERLRKENIEVVHLLSEEKVKRKKLMEQFHVEDYGSLTSVDLSESRPDLLEESGDGVGKESFVKVLEERLMHLIEAQDLLENRVKVLEEGPNLTDSENVRDLELTIKDLQEKFEWSNIVLTSKETEIFQLQNSFEDSAKTIEDLQRDLKEIKEELREKNGKLKELQVELESKNKQLCEVSVFNTSLNKSIGTENERAMSLEAQLRHLEQTVKDLEIEGERKEKAFMEIQGTLTEKNSQIDMLKKTVMDLGTELAITYEERLGNTEEFICDTEEKDNELSLRKKEPDNCKKILESEIEDLQKEIKELHLQKEGILHVIENKQTIIQELQLREKDILREVKNKQTFIQELQLKEEGIMREVENKQRIIQDLQLREKDILREVKNKQTFIQELQLKEEGILREVENKGRTIQELQLKEEGILREVENKERTIQELQLKEEGILREVENKERTIQELQLKEEGIMREVENKERTIQELQLKEEGILREVENKERTIQELRANVKESVEKESREESDAIQLKMKKLAATLKKKVLAEKDLLQQIKVQEELAGEKEKEFKKLLNDFQDVNEKWEKEKTEKDQFKVELATVLSTKSSTETENMELKEKLTFLENEYNAKLQKEEYKRQQMETQLQKMYENSERLRLKQEQDKEMMAKMESELTKSSAEIKNNEDLRHMLEEISGKYEQKKIEVDELCRDKSKAEEKLLEVRAEAEQLRRDNVCKEAKIQEQLAVAESLELDLCQTRDHLIRSEEKLSVMEEQRSTLESKTEELLKRIEEDSKNIALMDEMSNQIQALTESEQNLRSNLKSLHDKNKELKLEIEELAAEKAALVKEIAEFRQKLCNAHGELEKLRELDGEKSAVVEMLTAESERLKSVKMESKQKSFDIEKLQKDIELLEADLKENVENSKSIEKSLNHKIEELMQENATLSDKIKDLSENEEKRENEESNEGIKRKKSVTFRTDETSYIHDLKSRIQEYEEEKRKYEEEIAGLKMELLREKLRNEVTEVVSEAKEKVESLKSSPEKTGPIADEPKFDAKMFFGDSERAKESPFFDQQVEGLGASNQDQGVGSSNQDQNVDYESLMWDDGWGTDGHLEEQYLSMQSIGPTQEKYDVLEKELKIVEEEKRKIEEEHQQLQVKYAKVVKKMKEQKTAHDKLQSEVNRLKNEAEFGGLDGAIMDELKSQIAAYEQREKELIKSLESSKAEKEGLLKRIEVLNAGNEKLLEMKDRQDEVDRWENKNRALLNEITELRNELKNKEKEMSIDENDLVRELKNKITGLEWENCELKESLEEKQEMLDSRDESADIGKDDKMAKEVEELKEVKQSLERKLAEEQTKSKDIIEDLQQQIAALSADNDTLQEILNSMKKSQKSKTTEPAPSSSTTETETKVFDYFNKAPVDDVFSSIVAAPVFSEPVIEPVIESKLAVQLSAASNQFEEELQNLKQENGLLQQQLSEAQSVIETIKTERHEITEKYRTEYESALSFHLEEKNNALQKVYELEQALAVKIEELNKLSTRMRDLDQVATSKTEELNAVNQQRQEIEQALEVKSLESSNYLIRINELQQTLVVQAEELEKAKTIQSELESALRAKGNELNQAMEIVQVLQEKLRVREEEGYKILTEMAVKMEDINRLTLRTRELETECARKSASLENIQKTNEELLKNVQHSTPEIESLTRLLAAERSTVEELRGRISEKEDILRSHAEEAKFLKNKLNENEEKMKKLTQEYEKLKTLAEDYCDAKEKLEYLVSDLRTDLETVNIELDLSRKELEELRGEKDREILELEAKIEEATKAVSEVKGLREETRTRTETYEKELAEKESMHNEEMLMMKKASKAIETHVENLKSELKEKENDIFELSQTLDEEQKQLEEMRALLEKKDSEMADLKQVLNGFEEEIRSFRNFEKQVKELRLAQMGSNVSVTARGDPDFTNWTEHELTELNTRLQSDLDTALYMLHQRDIRCDELTFELMQLLEERDTLQLRLSTVIRINEELRLLTSNGEVSHVQDPRQKNVDVADQSNDRQLERAAKVPGEDLQQLAQKISQLHSVGYIKDKTIQDESARRHRDQMTLLGRVSDTDLGRESGSGTSATNWIRTGKTPPKIIHI